MKEQFLLLLDGIGNVLLGLPLVFFPHGVARLLDIPVTEGAFYPTILGSVFIGIGIALFVERFNPRRRGLGLGGAISINLTFGIVLGIWLLKNGEALSGLAILLLWILVAILVGISSFEWFSIMRKSKTAV